MKLLVLFLILTNASQAVTGLTPSIMLWGSELSGSLKDSNGFANIKRESNVAPGLSINLHFLGTSTRWEYQPFSYSTKVNVASNFSFDGSTYQVGDQLDLEMDWKQYDLEFRMASFGWDRPDTGGFDAKFSTGIKLIQAGLTLSGKRGNGQAPKVQFDEKIPVPYLGVNANLRLSGHWRLDSNVKYLDLSFDETSVKHHDWSIGLRYYTNPKSEKIGSFFMGWREQVFDLMVNKGAADESRLDLKQSGLHASYQIHF